MDFRKKMATKKEILKGIEKLISVEASPIYAQHLESILEISGMEADLKKSLKDALKETRQNAIQNQKNLNALKDTIEKEAKNVY